MKIRLIFLGFVFFVLWGCDQPDGYRDEQTASYTQLMYFKRPSQTPVEAVVYGNDQVGYFRTEAITQNAEILGVEVIPPSYVEGVNFIAESEGKKFPIARVDFANPTLEGFLDPKKDKISGDVNLTAPYYLVVGVYDSKTEDDKLEKREFVYVILNRLGEVVWMFWDPLRANQMLDVGSSSIPFMRLSDGSYLSAPKFTHLLKAKQAKKAQKNAKKAGDKSEKSKKEDLKSRAMMVQYSFVHRFNQRGRLTGNIKIPASKGKLHHDLLELENGNVLAIGSAPVQDGKTKWLEARIWEIDPVKNKAEIVWNSLDAIPPTEDEKPDYLHMNGLSMGEDGTLLVSFRHRSLVVAMDENYEILWDMCETGCDFVPEKESDMFYQQHHPSFVDEGLMVMFDNGKKRSRVVELALDPGKGTFRVVREFLPKREVLSKNRSSVYVLPDGNYLSYFLVNKDKQIIEFDRKTGEIVGQMDLETRQLGKYRVVPGFSLGEEVYIGTEYSF